MSSRRYGNRGSNNFYQWLYFVLFALITIWLLSSIFFKKNPIELFSNGRDDSTVDLKSEIEKPPYDTLVNNLKTKDLQLDDLSRQLAICKGEKIYKKGIIDIESTTVNMRSSPSLSSKIVIQIPDSSIVKIQYYDTEKYILAGKYGQWCRISYSNEEGWVWGNFIKEIE